MLNFNRLTKSEDRPNNDLALSPVSKDDRHPDGRFKMGPVNTEKKRGEGAIASAHGHIDDAAEAALKGDAEQANFHLSMANQYAGVGVQNHLMSNYAKETKGVAQKSDEERIRKTGYFFSGDTGGKDAGAAKAAPPQTETSVPTHLHGIADRHDAEADVHENVSRSLDTIGLIKRAGEHRQVAAEHRLAADHYRAAAGVSEDTSDGAGLARHLKAARDSAGQVAELTKCMG